MADDDWSSPSSWGGQAGGMWGAPQGGMGWGGGGGMQQPPGSPYGGFGGQMGYGGGYPTQSPYGAPGGYGGGYGMQSPYGYAMPQAYSQQQATPQGGPQQQGAPQQQAAPQGGPPPTPGAPPTPAAPQLNIDPIDPTKFFDMNVRGGTSQNTTFTPWEPLGNRYQGLWEGKWVDPKDHSKGKLFTGAEDELVKQQGLGPLGFDPSSEAGLARMEQLAGAGNPFYGSARDAVTGITSGQNRINTGGMFGQMYDDPGITGMGQYQNMANRDAIGNDQQYRDMIQRDAIGSGQFNQLYNQPGVSTGGYSDLAGQNAIGTNRMENFYGGLGAVGTGNYQNILKGSGGQGSLGQGMFGEVASGGRVDSNPYREAAITNAMNQASDATKAGMSARGRYGGSAYGDAMGRALGEVATNARMQGYDTDTAQMMQAAQAQSGEALARQGIGLQAAGGIAGAQGQNTATQMGAAQSMMNAQGQNYQSRLAALQGLTGAQSANVGQQMGAAQGLAGLQGTNAAQRLAQIQGLSGIQGQNYDARLGALGQMNQAQQMAANQRQAAATGMTGVQGSNIANRLSAAGMAPAMNQLRYDDATRMMQAGAAREAMAQQQRDFGWNQLQQYRGMLGNLPGAAGQTQSQTQQPWWQTALGLAAGGAGIWGAGGGV